VVTGAVNRWGVDFRNLTTIMVAKEKQVAALLRIAVSLSQRMMTKRLPIGAQLKPASGAASLRSSSIDVWGT
jgi:hypothetical protein